ncbi:stress enhanced protein 1, chloroplastic [Euphorbia lathyris]|uniref:stress enhanced protein 1, chloroplastic n=1 Tax=Euphorbia lathyris TaxID=212925 RepID=UPI00331418B6
MAIAQVSASLSLSIRDVCVIASPKTHVFAPLSTSSFAPIRSTFASGSGSPLLISRTSHQMKASSKARMVSIRSEQSSQGGNSLDVWLGRFAMTGFAVAITVEVVTGKGILENFGLITPLPTVALGVTGLVGVLTAIFIFQSASKN